MKMAVAVVVSCGLVGVVHGGGMGEPSSPEQARAWKALAKEFVDVATKQQKEVRAHARRILEALQKGEVDSLVDECTMYDATAKDRQALTRKYLTEHKAELAAAAKLADTKAPDFAADLQFESPEPAAGMPGRAVISFGPEVAPPKPGGPRRYPSRHQLVLMWSGPHMPEANGPVRATPPAGSKPGRWRFEQLNLPYSLTRGELL